MNLCDMQLPADVNFKTVLEFFGQWHSVVRLHSFVYNSEQDMLEVGYAHVMGTHPRLLKNANTLLRCYLNTLTDNGTCSNVRLRVRG